MSSTSATAGERRLAALGLSTLLLLALLLRLRYIYTLMPWFAFEDELRTIQVSLRLLQLRTLDPAYYYYPGLPFYTHALGYLLWALPGQLEVLLRHGPSGLLDYFLSLTPSDLRLLAVSRFLSLFLGLLSIPLSYMLFRLYLEVRWALAAAFLLVLNPIHLSLSVLAKVDAVALLWFLFGLYANIRYYREGSRRWLLLAAAGAAFYLMSKNNYQLGISVGLAVLWRALERGRGWRGVLGFADLWLAGLVMAAVGFAASPYSLLHLGASLENVGWLYRQSEIISTYHTDPHHWWLDRYYYLLTIVLPFVFGVPLFGVMVGAAGHHGRRWVREPFVFLNLIWYIYIFASQSGGPRGGAFPYYLFSHVVPLGILMAVEGLRDLGQSRQWRLRAVASVLWAGVLVWGVAGRQAHWKMFFSGYDWLGPRLQQEVMKPRERVLLLSVYYPLPALGITEIKAVWPQDFPGALDSYEPEIVVIDTWAAAGFRKVYRDEKWAPLPGAPATAAVVDEILAGGRGFREVERLRVEYLGWRYFAALDPEHDVELIILRRSGPEEGW